MDKEMIAKELVAVAKELTARENILDKEYPQYSLSEAQRSDERDEIEKALFGVGVDRQDAAQIVARVLTKRMTIRRAIETSSSFEYSGEDMIDSLKRVKVSTELTAEGVGDRYLHSEKRLREVFRPLMDSLREAEDKARLASQVCKDLDMPTESNDMRKISRNAMKARDEVDDLMKDLML